MEKKKKLDVVDAETLLATPLPPQTFLVENFLPMGLTIVGGPSKVGKSWLMLDLALHVATGEPLWGLTVRESDVLYLALEDTKNRLQSRLYQLADNIPMNLRFSVFCEKIGNGLQEQLTMALSDFPRTRLIIIDTFQCVRRPIGSARDNMYAADYADISAIKAIADQYNIAIIMIHHLRKLTDINDPFNDLSGSTGIGGAADTSFILRRPRGQENATLLITGRDIEYKDITLKFCAPKWELVATKNEDEIKKEKVPDVIFRLIDFCLTRHESKWTGTATELLAAMEDTVTPANALAKYVARYATEYLVPRGIRYVTGRNHGGRWLSFSCEQDCGVKNENWE